MLYKRGIVDTNTHPYYSVLYQFRTIQITGDDIVILVHFLSILLLFFSQVLLRYTHIITMYGTTHQPVSMRWQ